MEGFENLQPRKVIDGEIAIDNGVFDPIKMQLYVSPSGSIFARPVPPVPIDQIGKKEKRKRHANVDQS